MRSFALDPDVVLIAVAALALAVALIALFS
jgi:preprotein translocase subunit Sec61beta